jgi:glycogen phosphorylase
MASVAYFSMEVGLVAEMPTYAGGLGVLAGDTLRSAADIGVPMVAVTLLHRKGYFHQRIDAAGRQVEGPADWKIEQVSCGVA